MRMTNDSEFVRLNAVQNKPRDQILDYLKSYNISAVNQGNVR